GVVVSGCTVAGNQGIGGSNASGPSSDNSKIGTGFGGALVFSAGVATITNSTFDHNEALGGSGTTGGSGVLQIGVGLGGGIGNAGFLGSTTLTASNLTFTNNQAVGGAGNTGGVESGEGIAGAFVNQQGAAATLSNSTFAGNQAIGGQGSAGGNGADGLGGGLANLFGSTLTLRHCTLPG